MSRKRPLTEAESSSLGDLARRLGGRAKSLPPATPAPPPAPATSLGALARRAVAAAPAVPAPAKPEGFATALARFGAKDKTVPGSQAIPVQAPIPAPASAPAPADKKFGGLSSLFNRIVVPPSVPGGPPRPALLRPVGAPQWDRDRKVYRAEHPPMAGMSFAHPDPAQNGPDLQANRRAAEEAFRSKAERPASAQHLPGSMNHVFDVKLGGGGRYIVKPDSGLNRGEKVDHNQLPLSEISSVRNAAVHRIFDMAGHGHMAPHAFAAEVPQHWQQHLAPHDPANRYDEYGLIADPGATLHSHVGQRSNVLQHLGDSKAVGRMSDASLERVPSKQRAMGAVMHALTQNNDGHGGNVMWVNDPSRPEGGHLALIDHDMTMSSLHNKDFNGKPKIMSVFAPTGMLDYQHSLRNDPSPDNNFRSGGVGTNYADLDPRLDKTLRWLAAGGHMDPAAKDHGLGLPHEDNVQLANRARFLLDRGLEAAYDGKNGEVTAA